MSEAATGFSDFYERWFGRVYNYARHRTGSGTSADEIASDTFTRVYEAWSRFDARRGDRSTWLFSIAFRAVADHYRGQTRRGFLPFEAAKEPAEREPGPAEAAEQDQERARLGAALAKLEPQAREIVSLRFYGGMTNRAIAELLDLSEQNVAVILFRSVRKMRRSLSTEESHG